MSLISDMGRCGWCPSCVVVLEFLASNKKICKKSKIREDQSMPQSNCYQFETQNIGGRVTICCWSWWQNLRRIWSYSCASYIWRWKPSCDLEETEFLIPFSHHNPWQIWLLPCSQCWWSWRQILVSCLELMGKDPTYTTYQNCIWIVSLEPVNVI